MGMTKSRWIIVLGVGLLLAAVGGVLAVLRGASTFTATDHEVPGVFVAELEVGAHVVFELVGSTDRAGSFSVTKTEAPKVTDVRIVDPFGDDVSLENGFGQQTLTINDRIYVGIAQFDAEVAGAYTFDVDSSEPSTVRVGRSVFGLLGKIALPGLVALIGMSMAVLAAVMLFLGRKKGEPNAGGPYGGTPPLAGYYASPQDAPPAPQPPSPPPPPQPQRPSGAS